MMAALVHKQRQPHPPQQCPYPPTQQPLNPPQPQPQPYPLQPYQHHQHPYHHQQQQPYQHPYPPQFPPRPGLAVHNNSSNNANGGGALQYHQTSDGTIVHNGAAAAIAAALERFDATVGDPLGYGGCPSPLTDSQPHHPHDHPSVTTTVDEYDFSEEQTLSTSCSSTLSSSQFPLKHRTNTSTSTSTSSNFLLRGVRVGHPFRRRNNHNNKKKNHYRNRSSTSRSKHSQSVESVMRDDEDEDDDDDDLAEEDDEERETVAEEEEAGIITMDTPTSKPKSGHGPPQWMNQQEQRDTKRVFHRAIFSLDQAVEMIMEGTACRPWAHQLQENLCPAEDLPTTTTTHTTRTTTANTITTSSTKELSPPCIVSYIMDHGCNHFDDESTLRNGSCESGTAAATTCMPPPLRNMGNIATYPSNGPTVSVYMANMAPAPPPPPHPPSMAMYGGGRMASLDHSIVHDGTIHEQQDRPITMDTPSNGSGIHGNFSSGSGRPPRRWMDQVRYQMNRTLYKAAFSLEVAMETMMGVCVPLQQHLQQHWCPPDDLPAHYDDYYGQSPRRVEAVEVTKYGNAAIVSSTTTASSPVALPSLTVIQPKSSPQRKKLNPLNIFHWNKNKKKQNKITITNTTTTTRELQTDHPYHPKPLSFYAWSSRSHKQWKLNHDLQRSNRGTFAAHSSQGVGVDENGGIHRHHHHQQGGQLLESSSTSSTALVQLSLSPSFPASTTESKCLRLSLLHAKLRLLSLSRGRSRHHHHHHHVPLGSKTTTKTPALQDGGAEIDSETDDHHNNNNSNGSGSQVDSTCTASPDDNEADSRDLRRKNSSLAKLDAQSLGFQTMTQSWDMTEIAQNITPTLTPPTISLTHSIMTDSETIVRVRPEQQEEQEQVEIVPRGGRNSSRLLRVKWKDRTIQNQSAGDKPATTLGEEIAKTVDIQEFTAVHLSNENDMLVEEEEVPSPHYYTVDDDEEPLNSKPGEDSVSTTAKDAPSLDAAVETMTMKMTILAATSAHDDESMSLTMNDDHDDPIVIATDNTIEEFTQDHPSVSLAAIDEDTTTITTIATTTNDHPTMSCGICEEGKEEEGSKEEVEITAIIDPDDEEEDDDDDKESVKSISSTVISPHSSNASSSSASSFSSSSAHHHYHQNDDLVSYVKNEEQTVTEGDSSVHTIRIVRIPIKKQKHRLRRNKHHHKEAESEATSKEEENEEKEEESEEKKAEAEEEADEVDADTEAVEDEADTEAVKDELDVDAEAVKDGADAEAVKDDADEIEAEAKEEEEMEAEEKEAMEEEEEEAEEEDEEKEELTPSESLDEHGSTQDAITDITSITHDTTTTTIQTSIASKEPECIINNDSIDIHPHPPREDDWSIVARPCNDWTEHNTESDASTTLPALSSSSLSTTTSSSSSSTTMTASQGVGGKATVAADDAASSKSSCVLFPTLSPSRRSSSFLRDKLRFRRTTTTTKNSYLSLPETLAEI